LSAAFLRQVAGYAIVLTAATMVVFAGALEFWPQAAGTLAFMSLGGVQIVHLTNARRQNPESRMPPWRANPFALAAAGIAIALQTAAVVYPGLRGVLGTQALEPAQWLVIIAAASVPAIVGAVARRSIRS
jgi:magnesium-transporting ATPase (P-type)